MSNRGSSDRRDVEERVQLVVLGRLDCGQHRRRRRPERLLGQPALGAAVVLNGPDPIQIGRQGVVSAREAPDGAAGRDVDGVFTADPRRRRIRPLARRLHLDRAGKERRGQSGHAERTGEAVGATIYLKSRREKTKTAIVSSMAV